jgi:hypothetical protein
MLPKQSFGRACVPKQELGNEVYKEETANVYKQAAAPGSNSGRARDVESRTILANFPLLAAAEQEDGRSATSLGRTVAAISPWGTGRCDLGALQQGLNNMRSCLVRPG